MRSRPWISVLVVMSAGLAVQIAAAGPQEDVAAALKRALTAAFGKEPSFVRDGGSMGAITGMERVLRCPILFLDLSLPEHGYHAANEYFEWGQAEKGIVAFARLLAELAGPDGLGGPASAG